MLELEGTVDIRQSSGVYVMRIPSASDDEEEAFFRSDVGPFEMLQARQLLESNIAAFAAKMATKADIENLRRTLEQEQRAIAANDSSQDNDKLFHLLLAGASQNQMLLDTVTSIWRHHDSSPLWQQLRPQFETRAYRLKWLGDHQTILAALRRRDVMGPGNLPGSTLRTSRIRCWSFPTPMRLTLMATCLIQSRSFRGN